MLRWAGSCGGGQAGWGRSSSSRQCSPCGAARARRARPRKKGRAEHRLGSHGGVSPGTIRGGRGEVRGGLCPQARSRAAVQRRPVVPAGGQQSARARALPELRPPVSRRRQRRGRPGSRLGAEEGRRRPAAPATGRPRRRPLPRPRRRIAETPLPSSSTAAPPRRRPRRRRRLRRGQTRACRSCPVPRPRRPRRSRRSPSRRGSGSPSERPSRWSVRR